MKKTKLVFATILICGCQIALGNEGSSALYVKLQKLHSLKRVLYVAAHPDDENTRALAWFSLGEKAETAYFSFTRGDGGQNLLGNELGEELGVLRTQELLSARSFDKARQYFSRGVDFGYSRSAEESFEKWGKDEMLSDLVLVIRQFRPDVIITRFPADNRGGHGHHTASGILAAEAFEKAADEKFLPNQVQEYGSWKTTSIYWNTSIWWNRNLDSLARNDPNYLVADIGGYSPELGMSYNEIGTLARSEHRCQGFGGIISRGSRKEYFQNLGGEKLEKSFFEKNTQSWSALVDKDFNEEIESLLENFNFRDVKGNVQPLLSIRKGLEKMENSPIKNEKIELCNELIADCLGLYCEVLGPDYSFVAGNEQKLRLNLINRSDLEVKIQEVSVNGEEPQILNQELKANIPFGDTVLFSGKSSLSGPYWLRQAFVDRFVVANPDDLGKAENDPTVSVKATFTIGEDRFSLNIPVTYKWRDPSFGERRREFICVPQFTVNADKKLVILKPGGQTKVRLKVHAFEENISSKLYLAAPAGWILSQNEIEFSTTEKHEEIWIEFDLKVAENAEKGSLQINDATGNMLMGFTEIEYDHIRTQIIFRPAQFKCIHLDARIMAGRVAYIKGIDDEVPEAIEQLGFEVDLFEVSDLATTDLTTYKSVVLGIRIYNVHPELFSFNDKLKTYVEQGGNLIMQYNTASRSFANQQFGPGGFELSRNRVTEEDAVVTFLNEKHPIMNTPNKISQADFKDWVQERGLYFAGNWDDSFTPLFSWHDKDQDDVEGALIVAKVGQGRFIYTGISFFRELPKGVSGAYRLFANLLSYSSESE
ncbi:PIG-L family deacetylase [Crocinitomix catalasitica]|nr:PIG-L family deacetylase [Crocinitomix catalasitica]